MLTRTLGCLLILPIAAQAEPSAKPQPAPDAMLGLIGEYARGRDKIIAFEKDGKLHCSIGWFFAYSLTQETRESYTFPAGLYRGKRLVFKLAANGKATEVEAASQIYLRRKLDGEDGQTSRIKPQRPIDELRREALAATPPVEKKEIRAAELVDATTIDATIKLDLRYASDNNFLSTPLYPKSAKAYMQKPAAVALAKVSANLKKVGYGLLIFDSYRPWYVTRIFYDATPEKFRNFVADPSQGSRHNRGCAVDLTLYELKTDKPVEMVSGFDEFSDRAFPDYPGGTSLQRWHRDLLRKRMESEGFTVYAEEWWHFDYKNWKQYRICNQTFEELAAKK